MAEVTKYQLITNNNNNNNNNNNHNILSDLKTHFSFFKTRKSTCFIYAALLIFVLCTIFLAFSPSSPSFSSPWFVNIFTVNSTSPSHTSQSNSSRSQNNATFDEQPIFNHSLPSNNNTQISPDHNNTADSDRSQSSSLTPQIPANNSVIQPEKQLNDSISDNVSPQITPSLGNQSSPQLSPSPKNQTSSETSPQLTPKSSGDKGSEVLASPKNESSISSDVLPPIPRKKGSGLEVNSSDLSASLSKNENKNEGKKPRNDSVSVKKQGNEIGDLVGCDLYDGGWIRDESYPLYKAGTCKLVDEQFNCLLNGRPDRDYQKLKWKPKACSLPRLNGGQMLKLLKGKRLVFVGDSLNRNMWESLVCILKNSVKNKKKVYEAFGHHRFRTEASYSFVFKDYNCTVEFYVAPFLVQQWEAKDKNGTTQETLRLDLMVSDANQYKSADYIVFNTGHWWTHDKTSKGEDYYQEGSHVYKQLAVTEAFRKALTTWARWVDANIDPQRTHVLFRGYSASHFRGGQWNSGGQCDSETEPIKNEAYLTKYPWKMKTFESVIKEMKTPVSFLNVTRLTDYRKDGHPSVFRKHHLAGDEKKSPLRYQDCSHWCLPGVPDSWNELLYAELLRKQYLEKQAKNKT